MDESLKALLETKDIWIPALTALFARFSATRPGHSIERTIKEKLKWLKAPESEKAFFEAFEEGLEKFSTKRGNSAEARAAVHILSASIRDETSALSLPNVLEQIYVGKADKELLLNVASRQAIELEDALVPSQKVATELGLLIEEFLHPAFLANKYFTQQVGFSELIAVVKEIHAELAVPGLDLEKLHREYLLKTAEKYDVIPMQGISPKIQNRTIGMRMEEIFIPLELMRDRTLASMSEYFTEFTVHPDIAFTDEAPRNIKFNTPLPSMGTASPALPWVTTNTFLQTESDVMKKGQIRILGTDVSPDFFKVAISQINKPPKSAKIEKLLDSPRVVVKGDPGSGKSTLARYIAWALTKGRTEVIGDRLSGRVPILIRAIDFGEALEQHKVESLEEYLTLEAGRFAPVIKQALLCSNALVLIDGLDEVGKPALRARVKERTDDFIADPVFTSNYIFITTRIVGYERSGLTGRFQHFTITDLDKEQIRKFILNWYAAIERETPGLINAESESAQLDSAINANESIRKMARNPLLLTIIALIKWQGRTLPEQRVLLYDAAAQTLIKSWPLTQRRVEFDELFIREWLAPIALHILSDRTGDLIDEFSLTTELSDVMQQLRSMTEIQARSDTRELLDNISEHSGFLLPRDTDKDGNNLYGFLHQTFAEYLAAYYLVGRWEDDDLDLAKYAHDPYWREVFFLMAGHLGTQRRAKAGKFVDAVRNLNSSAYENMVHRDLLLACQILADGTPAGPANIIESLLSALLQLWAQTDLAGLRIDIDRIFKKLRGTEYAEVLARLATSSQLAPRQIVMLAKAVGAELLGGALVNVLHGTEPALGLSAAELLFESQTRQSIDAALQLASSEDVKVKRQAVRLLINAEDTRGIPFLIDLLKNKKLDVWMGFNDFKLPNDPSIPDAVATLLTDDQFESQANAAALLTHWDDPRGIEASVSLMNSNNPTLPMSAFALINELERLDEETLHQLLGVTHPTVQLFVGMELVRRDDSSGINALLQSERQQEFHVVSLVSDALADSQLPEAIGTLKERMSNSSPIKRIHAARALGKSGDQSAVDVLATYLSSEDPRMRVAAVEGLIGHSKLPLLENIHWILGSTAENDVGTQVKAVTALGRIKDPGALKSLIGLLDDKRPEVQHAAAEILVSRDESEAIQAMTDHIPIFTQELGTLLGPTPPTSLGSHALASFAYEFVKRHLTPSGELGSTST